MVSGISKVPSHFALQAPMTIDMYDSYFKDFSGRSERLRNIIRYHIYPTMFYRTNLAMHSKRVAWQTLALLDMLPSAARSSLDEERIILMAWVHDDHEIIAGDHQSGNEKHMTKEQFAGLHQKEARAVDELCKIFPETIGNYKYRDLLSEAVRVDTIGSQIIKLADKIEGSGEALHEVFGGNTSFSSGIIDPDYQKEIHAPPVYYGKYFDALFDKLPLLSPLSAFLALPLITAAISDDLIEMSKDRFPHTRASLDIPTGYAPYDYWKKNFLSHADEDEVKQLYIKTE